MKGRKNDSIMKTTRHRIMAWCVPPFITCAWSLPCHGQDIEPRRWSHLPIGGNFAGAGYAYTTGDTTQHANHVCTSDSHHHEEHEGHEEC